jgi:TonB-dependent SusC/RagA subfamily outer membrane receptor
VRFVRQTCSLVALLVLGATSAWAQERRITGRVVGEGADEPLAAASVNVVGTTIGAYTGEDGRFNLLAPAGPLTLRVRRIGYKQETVQVPADQTTELSISLTRDVLQLEKTVVTGAATSVASQNAAQDVAVVTADQLNRVPTPTVENALQGKIAGAQISQNSGAPGGGVQVRLRGVTSIFGSSDPLYVIDGVLMSNDVIQSGINAVGQASTVNRNASSQDNGVNRIADLNPADIETIEVLKGASASSIYGSKASNGVIVITTKKGSAGRPQVNITQRVGTFDLANKFDDRRFTLEEAYEYGVENGVDSATVLSNYQSCNGYCDTQEQIFGKNPLAYETSLSVRGGTSCTGTAASSRTPATASSRCASTSRSSSGRSSPST